MSDSIKSDEILKEVLLSAVKEQRLKRRWGIFFKLSFLALTIFFLFFLFGFNTKFTKSTGNYAALVDINGVIDNASQANADYIVSGLDSAFKDPNTKGIILRINSPGGSPVQASEVYNEILRQRHLHPSIKIYAVCTDICTSAAYYIASSTNQIYANPASLVGSIGVLIDSFGFVGGLQKLGVERRLLTSGRHKGFLDPFSPLNDNDVRFVTEMLDNIHAKFIQDVVRGRGNRLKINADTFSGYAWTGAQALPQGLIDGFGSAGEVARNVIKTDDIVDYTVKPNPIDLFVQKVGASFAVHFLAAVKSWQVQ
jgi:protease-4